MHSQSQEFNAFRSEPFLRAQSRGSGKKASASPAKRVSPQIQEPFAGVASWPLFEQVICYQTEDANTAWRINPAHKVGPSTGDGFQFRDEASYWAVLMGSRIEGFLGTEEGIALCATFDIALLDPAHCKQRLAAAEQSPSRLAAERQMSSSEDQIAREPRELLLASRVAALIRTLFVLGGTGARTATTAADLARKVWQPDPAPSDSDFTDVLTAVAELRVCPVLVGAGGWQQRGDPSSAANISRVDENQVIFQLDRYFIEFLAHWLPKPMPENPFVKLAKSRSPASTAPSHSKQTGQRADANAVNIDLPSGSAPIEGRAAKQALSQSAGPGGTPPLSQPQYEAKIIAEMFGSAVLQGIAAKNMGSLVASQGYKGHRDNVLTGCGSPTDPIEAMMVEQLLWAHHRLGILQCQAAEAKTAEEAVLLDAAAARLMAECRKMALALREYRSPFAAKQVTVVKQQNVAAGDQQIAMIETADHTESGPEKTSDIKLASNQALLDHVERSNPFTAAADRRSPEPVEAPTVNGRRHAAAS